MTAASRKKRGAAQPLPSLERDVGRHPLDFYETPAWATDALVLGEPFQAGPGLFRPSRWVDIGCGTGAIAARCFAAWPGTRGTGIEIDSTRATRAAIEVPGLEVIEADARRRSWAGCGEPYGFAVSNPPFALALDFARAAVALSPRAALLVRVGFLEAEEGSERDHFLRANPPGVALLNRRPPFRGDGETDSAAYCWALWGPGWGGRFWRLKCPSGRPRKPERPSLTLPGVEP